jgi:DNA-binding GntR family transcriptional regulator
VTAASLAELSAPKLQRSSLADGAYTAIKKLIIETELMPGQTVSEGQLAATLGISRSPVRQALARLKEEGFIEIEAWKPARVAALTPQVVQDLYSVRTALEARAARESAPFLPEGDVAAMRATLERLAPQIAAGDYAAFIAIEHEFHGLFIDSCPNRLLRGFLAGLQDHLERVRHYYRSEVRAHKEQEFDEHVRIVTAMTSRDPDLLERAVREHLEGFTQRLLADLAAEDTEALRTRP